MEQEYLTVTALTKYIKTKFDRDPHLDRVYLTGEISNFNKNSVHKYFNLRMKMRLSQQQCSKEPIRKFNSNQKKE